jgi:putative addiction module component (TIGR02574 family)
MDSLKETLNLSVPERILTVEAIWDSIARDTSVDIPLTKEQELEIIQRLERYEKGESTTYTWEEMIAKLKSEK